MTRLTATSRLINKFTQNGYLFSAAEAAQDSFPEITLAGLSKLVDQMNGNLAVSSMLFGTLLVGGDISAAITQTTKSQIGNMSDVAPLNPGGTNGSLLIYSRNVAGAEIVMATQNTVRGRWSSTGLAVTLAISAATAVVGTDPTGAALLRVGGLVRSGATGTAGYQFDDRATGDTWTWSASGGVATLATTVNSPISITRSTGAITLAASLAATTGLSGTTLVLSGQQTSTVASGVAVALETNAAAAVQRLLTFRRGASSAQWGLGFDAADLGAIINQAGTSAVLSWDNGGNFIAPTGSFRSGSPGGGIGYSAGAGGAVGQATSKATGVALNNPCGAITLNAASLAAGAIVSFVLTNSAIAATDTLVLNHISGGTPGSYTLNARCAAGSATIDVRNNTAGALAEAIVIQFTLIKGVNA